MSTAPDLVDALTSPERPADERVEVIVVDWERQGKAARQRLAEQRIGTDTQISSDTPADLARVRSSFSGRVICRVNAPGPRATAEIGQAADLGADEVLLPMVRSEAHVVEALKAAGDRVGVGILVETVDAVARIRLLAGLPITRVYVGLMDLSLDRGTSSIFEALIDGTVERVRAHVRVPFGVGGLTIPGSGHPIPADLLIGEMARLRCGFSFLRRSFTTDTAGLDRGKALRRIRHAIERTENRPPERVKSDRGRFVSTVRQTIHSAGSR